MAASAAPALRGSKLTLSFGLVSVPVAMKPLHDTQRPIPGKGMCPEHGPTLTMPRFAVCCVGTDHEHEVPNDEKQTGYPHPNDPTRFVVVDPEVVKAIAEPKSATATVEKMVDVDAIDAGYLDKPFLVWPQAGGEEAFDLLAAWLREEGKAAVITTVLSKQTQQVLFQWSEHFGCVVAHSVKFETRIRLGDVAAVRESAAARPAPKPELVDVARQLFSSLEGEFDPTEVEDEITLKMRDAIVAADDGREYVVVEQAEKATPSGDGLLAALQASVGSKPKPKAKPKAAKPKPKAPARRPARREKVAA